MASPSSAKRKRLTHEVQPVQAPTRGKPYFNNGNIILAVENTHFRIPYGVLAVASPIFANLSSASESPTEQVLHDGCPVIELDDSAEEWGHVLWYIFERRYPLIYFQR